MDRKTILNLDNKAIAVEDCEKNEPLRILNLLKTETNDLPSSSSINEGNLIQKFIHGESDIPDIYTKSEIGEDDDYDENADLQEHELNFQSLNIKSEYANSDTKNSKLQNKTHGKSSNMTIIRSGVNVYKTRRKSVLNCALQGLMGEANLSYARGQIDMAEKICFEIIRQNPLASEPFFTLAEIYETQDAEKSLNFLTIAVHLNPDDREQWVRLTELHISRGNIQRARLYFSRAIRSHPRDYDLRLRKAQFLEMIGERHAAMLTYMKTIQHIPLDMSEFCLLTAKKIARYFHVQNKYQIALEAMSSAYNVCGHAFTLKDIYMYIELLMLNKKYDEVVICLKECTNFELETDLNDTCRDTGSQANRCVIPDDFFPDLRAKLCISLVFLKTYHLIEYLIQNVHDHIPIDKDSIHLYIDIADALMQEEKYTDAITLLKPILNGDHIDCRSDVFLREANCLRYLNCIGEAIEVYKKVIELAPLCYEARFTLSSLLKQQGRHLEAVKALEQPNEESHPLHFRLLYERCLMLYQLNKTDECLNLGYILLSRQSTKLRSRDEIITISNGGSVYNAEGIKAILQMRNMIDEDSQKIHETYKHVTNDDLAVQDEYELFVKLLSLAFKHHKYSLIERLCFSMVTSKRFICYSTELGRTIILACYFNNDCSTAFSYLRELIQKNISNVQVWNMLSLLIQKGQDIRYHRYISRLISRQPSARNMRIFLAHYHLHCSSYKYALNVYGPIMKECEQPIVALCIAVVFNQISLQKKTLRKCAAVSQALFFANKYATLRSCDINSNKDDSYRKSAVGQEIYYNIGRIYHQSGILHLAIEYYDRALKCHHNLIEQHSDDLSLQQEIAFNLHLIYKSNGNMVKARQYLYEYCII